MAQSSADHIFISYSRKDNEIMRRIVSFLHDSGFKVWVDNERLIPGTPIWEEEIEKAIIRASAIVVILSPDAKNSEWVRREIGYAEQYNKPIFPVIARGDRDSAMTLRLVTHQYIDLHDDEASGLDSLVAALSLQRDELQRKKLSSCFTNFLIILMIITACYFGYSQIKARRNVVATVTPQTTPGATLFLEDFSNNTKGWFTGSEDNEFYTGSTSITNGVLVVDIQKMKQPFFSRQSYGDNPIVGNFDAGVEAKRVGGTPGKLCYGICFRSTSISSDADSIYIFKVCDTQSYTVYYYENANFITLQDWTNTPIIRPDDWNHLEIVGIGNQFWFYINHQEVSQINDARSTTGYIYLFLSVSDDVPGQVWFDNFQISTR